MCIIGIPGAQVICSTAACWSSQALGLGSGDISVSGGELGFEPASDILQDGLPADAWTNVGNTLGGRAPVAGQRPLNEAEMRRILEAEF